MLYRCCVLCVASIRRPETASQRRMQLSCLQLASLRRKVQYVCTYAMSDLCINWCVGNVFFFEPKLQYSKACNSIGPFVVFFLKPWTLITYVRINIRRIRDTYIWWRVFSDTSLNVLKTLSTVLQVYSRQTVSSYVVSGSDIRMHRSRCHGNVRLNDDSKSHRIIPKLGAWR